MKNNNKKREKNKHLNLEQKSIDNPSSQDIDKIHGNKFIRGNFFDENKFILLTVFIGILIILSTYAVFLYYPFGDNTILKVDLYHQYGPFHEELRSKILSGASLLYSWEGGLGKELITQIAYYTSSPISLLILLFPQKNLPEAMALFAMIKIAAAGGFFAYYLKRVYNKNDLTITAFGLLYGFMAFLTCYYWNIMWLDIVAMFPMVAFGIECIVKEGKYVFYMASLAITIFINFYIAFIVCIFSVLYFAVILFANYSIGKDKKIIIERCIIFAVSSLISGCVAMVLILPSAIALSHTQTSDSSFPKFKLYSNVYQLLENNFLGARPVVLGRNEDLPNIYSGLFSIILLPCYFSNKKFPLKEKILFAVLLIFIYACSCINVMDYIIHGMHFPSNLPHRYAFVYSFLVICLAYKVFLNIKDVKINFVIPTCFIYALILLISEYLIVPNIEDIERIFSDKFIFINIAMMAAYCIFIYYIKVNKNNKQIVINLILLLFIIVEALTSSMVGVADRMKWVKTEEASLEDPNYESVWTEKIFGGKYTGTTSRSQYIKYIDGVNEALDYIDENDNDENTFHRMEVRRFKAINSASLYHYNGLSQFSSLAYGDTSKAMEKIGIAATSNSYRYYDPTPLFNSLFNIKYIISTEDKLDDLPYKYLESFGANEDKKDDVFLYENEQPLSLGFMVNSDVKDWDMDTGNPFEIQNQFLKLATGKDFEYLHKKEVEDMTYNYIEITEHDEDKQMYKYSLQEPYDLDTRIPEVKATVHNDKEQRVFLYINAGNCKQVTYSHPSLKGSQTKQNRDFSTGRGYVDLGTVPADCDIQVSFKLDRKGEFEKTYRKSGDFSVFACTFDPEVYDKAYGYLDDEMLTVDDYGDDYIHGNITALNDGIMFTSIPYDKGWSLMVDGKEKDFIAVAHDGFIGIELEKGEHEIYFKYHAKGLIIGAVVSILAILAFIFFTVRGKIIK